MFARFDSRKVASAVAAAAILALAGATTVAALNITVSGKAVSAVKVAVSTAFHTNESTSYVAMPGMSLTVKVPSSQRAILLITFASEVNCNQELQENEYCYVRVLVDGNEAQPGEVVFDSNADNYATGALEDYIWETNSMQFVSASLAPGSHTVTVQWRVNGGDSTFWIAKRTLSVLRVRA